MENINDYRRKFNILIESKMGNVKPLLTEQPEVPEQKSNIKNFFTNFKNRLKTNTKIKNWVKKIFGKENPEEKEVLDYIKGPKEPQQYLTPTTPPQEVQVDSQPTEVNQTQQTIGEEEIKDYYNVLFKYKSILLKQTNIGINNYIVPIINSYLNSEVNKYYGKCYSNYIFGETCFGGTLKVLFNKLTINNIILTKGSGKVMVKYNASAGIQFSFDAGFYKPSLWFYPSISGTFEIIGNKTIIINSPKVSLWTNWFDIGIAYVYINDNKLKMHNRFAGPYEWALPIQSSVNNGFKGKSINIEKELPELYKLINI